MKLQAHTVATTTITGEVSEAELLAWIGRECNIPAGAACRLWVGDDPLDISVNLGNPLRFTITWDTRVITPPTSPEEPALPA